MSLDTYLSSFLGSMKFEWLNIAEKFNTISKSTTDQTGGQNIAITDILVSTEIIASA